MESKFQSLYVSQNSINRLTSNHSITEEINALQALFRTQAKQIQEVSEKLLVYQELNKRLKLQIAEHYNEKLMDSLTKLNLTGTELVEDPEFLKKIKNEPVPFQHLFHSIDAQEGFSPLVNKFLKVSNTVMNI